MKKVTSQIAIAVVCAMLGFLLSYQFKLINKKQQAVSLENYDKTTILTEIESLKKEKEELQKKNEALTSDLKKLEEAAVSKGDLGDEIKKELDKTRMVLGVEDVRGPGIVLTITPKSQILGGTNTAPADLSERELIHVINLLVFSGAEAISINDYRITPQTGLKKASDFIWIGNNERISPRDPIVIKAIGEQNNLIKGITFTGEMEYGALRYSYSYEYKKEDELVINKTTQNIEANYIKNAE